MTGYTSSTDFPTKRAFQYDPGDNNYDVFLTKFTARGDSLVYSTYLGGSARGRPDDFGEDYGNAIAVDQYGQAYVTGTTTSIDFPVRRPYMTDPDSDVKGRDAFVSKLKRNR